MSCTSSLQAKRHVNILCTLLNHGMLQGNASRRHLRYAGLTTMVAEPAKCRLQRMVYLLSILLPLVHVLRKYGVPALQDVVGVDPLK